MPLLHNKTQLSRPISSQANALPAPHAEEEKEDGSKMQAAPSHLGWQRLRGGSEGHSPQKLLLLGHTAFILIFLSAGEFLTEVAARSRRAARLRLHRAFGGSEVA